MNRLKKNTDKITQAYYYEFGKEFGQKVRNRIHWILSNSIGESILDVGCSQGLISILLAREGKDVVGIDISGDAIQFANEQLEKEEATTKKHVTFIHDNFIDHKFENKFDAVIMGEFLEHITDTGRFIKKAIKLLNDNGRLIVTVPFGVNDYFDHKHTYYLKSLVDFTKFGLSMEKIKFMGKWVGAVYKVNVENSENRVYTPELIHELETAFEAVERDNINEIVRLKEQLSNNRKELKEQLFNYRNELDKVLKENESIKNDEKNSFQMIERLKAEIAELKEIIEKQRVENVSLKRKIIEQQEAEKKLLLDMKKLMKRYESLRKSKLGRLTVKYWKWKNR